MNGSPGIGGKRRCGERRTRRELITFSGMEIFIADDVSSHKTGSVRARGIHCGDPLIDRFFLRELRVKEEGSGN
jgi:hypothetical protein